MIAAVKGWHAVSAALLFFSASAGAADDPGGAAKELARKTTAFAGRGAAVAIVWRNLSSLDSAANQARAAFEDALQQAGLRTGDLAPLVEAKVTLSEDASQYLLVEEASKGDEHQVWISAWKRVEPASTPSGGLTLEKKLVWEQPEPILDVAFPPAGMLVLSPSGVTLYARNGAQWQSQRTVLLTPAKPWPADLRGHLRLRGAGFQALLPGLECDGTADPSLSAECHASEEPWVLESGSRGLLLASFAAARNYFDGRITTQGGQRKNIPPFFSAASVESQGRTWWLLAATDGRIQVFDNALEPSGVSSAQWGSDIAGTDAHCGAGSQVLATRPGDRSQLDSIQAFNVSDRTPQPLTDPADFPGPVMALWTSGGSAATAVVKNLRSQQYSAYVVTVVCGN
ncbi:MAG TPA: hypothetical protein VMB03_00825 [Bryobacteraceae bacterium]|nr:hypothetical protein [Bryobacteraceae bacterium]